MNDVKYNLSHPAATYWVQRLRLGYAGPCTFNEQALVDALMRVEDQYDDLKIRFVAMTAAKNKAVAELRRLADNQAIFTEEQLTDHARVDLSLIAELEKV